MSHRDPLHLFEGVGIELEYMVVDRDSLDVRAIVDELIRAEAGRYEAEIERGPVAWSNELALHVMELKTNGPAKTLAGVAAQFQGDVMHANRLLQPSNAMLLPSAMHPWMNPERELRLWPHEHNPIYETFDRIFDCRGHGWANLQSMHVNLPFADDEELGPLHAAVRFLLPIMPALAASSPVVDGLATGLLDSRLDVYRHNTARVPSLTGAVIPEPVFTRAEYEREILGRIYTDLAPHDPRGVLRHEWANARGCIARFDRMALEIRVLDVQEIPAADLAVASAIISALRSLTAGKLCPVDRLRAWPTERLVSILRDVIRDGDQTRILDLDYRALLGDRGGGSRTALELWDHLLNAAGPWGAPDPPCAGALQVILTEGCLARRILRRLDGDFRPARLREVYGELGACLAAGRSFLGDA